MGKTNTQGSARSNGSRDSQQSAIFGPPPLLNGEDPRAYDKLLAEVSSYVKPADILEEIWVREVVDLVWEVFRMRRLKVSLMNAMQRHRLRKVLGAVFEGESADRLTEEWLAGDPVAIQTVDEAIGSRRLSMDAVMAEAISTKLDDIEQIDRLIAMAETRSNGTLREIDRHRDVLGQALRRSLQKVEENELRVIEGGSRE
jgi:hypothetical protein